MSRMTPTGDIAHAQDVEAALAALGYEVRPICETCDAGICSAHQPIEQAAEAADREAAGVEEPPVRGTLDAGPSAAADREVTGYLHELACPGPPDCSCERVWAVFAWV